MVKYLFLSIIVTSAAKAAENAGMPQLNSETWVPQIFWLTITFSILYVVIAKIVLPRLSASIEQRDDHVSDLIDGSKNLKDRAEEKYQEYLNLISVAKKESQELMSSNKKKLQDNFEIKKKEINKRLEVKLQEVEEEVKSFKKESIANIENISSAVAKELVQKISKTSVNDASANIIVKEVSKNYLKGIN